MLTRVFLCALKNIIPHNLQIKIFHEYFAFFVFIHFHTKNYVDGEMQNLKKIQIANDYIHILIRGLIRILVKYSLGTD